MAEAVSGGGAELERLRGQVESLTDALEDARTGLEASRALEASQASKVREPNFRDEIKTSSSCN